MAAARVLPQPPAAALAGWLPSRGHPSDHLAVVADLEWLPGGAAAGARPPRAEDEGDGEPAGAGPHGGCAAPRGADGLGAGQPRAPAPRASCSKGAAGSGGAGGAAVSGPAPRRRRPPSAGAVSCEAGGPGSGDRPPAGEPAGAAGDGRPADGAPAGPGPSPGAGGNGAIAGGRADARGRAWRCGGRGGRAGRRRGDCGAHRHALRAGLRRGVGRGRGRHLRHQGAPRSFPGFPRPCCAAALPAAPRAARLMGSNKLCCDLAGCRP